MDQSSFTRNSIRNAMNHAEELGVIRGQFADQKLNGTTLNIKGRDLIHFANCSYLGLEFDPQILEAAKDALNRYGITFACSRSYLESEMFEILEEKLSQLFGKPVLLPPSTSLGHISWIPNVVSKKCAIIMDQQVHRSVQNACLMAKGMGVRVEIVRHNRMDLLEERIIELCKNHHHVWYMADGVYSMFGDTAPMQILYDLMEKYPQFHIYIDDAHGMSWTGENGKGYALSKVTYFHDKLCLITSLSKGFGVNGAAMVFAKESQKEMIKTVGSAIIFSNPIPPVMLASSLASADIHLSSAIYEKQNKLESRMKLFLQKANEFDLPIVRQNISPIAFIGTGANPIDAIEVASDLQKDGYFVNASSYPIVPLKNAGLRITINAIHSDDAITGLLTSVKNRLNERGIDKSEVLQAFAKNEK